MSKTVRENYFTTKHGQLKESSVQVQAAARRSSSCFFFFVFFNSTASSPLSVALRLLLLLPHSRSEEVRFLSFSPLFLLELQTSRNCFEYHCRRRLRCRCASVGGAVELTEGWLTVARANQGAAKACRPPPRFLLPEHLCFFQKSCYSESLEATESRFFYIYYLQRLDGVKESLY